MGMVESLLYVVLLCVPNNPLTFWFIQLNFSHLTFKRVTALVMSSESAFLLVI